MAKNFLRKLFSFFIVSTLMTSCSKNTNDPNETFKYWSGFVAPKNIKLLKGQYWQSSHFSKEYIMYLKFKPTNKFWNEYIEINGMSEEKNEWTIPADAPQWFTPSENSKRYYRNEEFDQGSRYFYDTKTNICYIYEIQL